MMSTPAPYPTVTNNAPAPDDAQIESKMPTVCVDYLSHQWTDEDVWSSWKAMTKQKDKIANGVRLENASWRTWAKQRGNLKTISPETLNWLKDSDVTWLYGPLHEHADPVPPPKQATTADRLDLEDGHSIRSILKHRTISELLTTPGRAASPGAEIGNSIDAHMEFENQKEQENRTRLLFSVKSDSNLVGRNSTRNAVGSPTHFRPPEPMQQQQPEPQPTPNRAESTVSEEKRHISFNQRVEQCIAVNRDFADYNDYSEEEEEYDDDDGEKSSDEEEVLTMKSSPRVSPATNFTAAKAVDHPIIAKLAPTRLKTSETYPSPSPTVVDPTGFMSSQGGNGATVSSYPHSFGYATGIPANAREATARGVQWDVDEDFSGDFDYFNGPDLTDGSDDHGASHDSGPVFNTGDASSPDATRSYTSYFDHSESDRADGSSASTSPQDYLSAPDQSTPTVGPRGILKKRPVIQNQRDDYESRGAEAEELGVLGTSQADATGSFADSYENARGSCERGRTSQRLGSSASYERIQDAARSARTRSNSAGSVTSHSPNGNLTNGSYDERYSATSPSTSPNAHRGPSSSTDATGDSFRGKEATRDGEGGRPGDQGYSGGGKAGQARSAFAQAGVDSDFSDGQASSYGLASPPLDEKAAKDHDGDRFMYGDERSYWSDDKPAAAKGSKAPGTPSRSKTTTASAAAVVGGAELSVDTENVPSNSPNPDSIEVGPTPLNTPTFILSRSSGKRRSGSDAMGPTSPTLPRRQSATGALVAPGHSEPRVPLAPDYVEEDEGGLVGRAVEIVNTARDLIGALLGTGDRGRSWREG